MVGDYVTQALSLAARTTLIEHLERLLCEPTARATHLSRLKKSTTGSINHWDPTLLQQLMDDARRLEVLEDGELQQLLSDPIGLNVLGEEVTREWWPAWAEPLASVGREWRERAAGKPPTWDDISTESADCNSTELVEAEALAGHLGDLLDKSHDPKGRPLLFEWLWSRTRKQLGLKNEPAADSRLVTEFRLQAFGKRQGTPGEWVLYVAGDPPESHAANVTLRLTGWGQTTVDCTNSVSVRTGVTEIRLTSLPEPTSIFADWLSGAAEVSVKCIGNPHSWQTSEMVPSPRLDRSLYELWADPKRTDGIDNCLARLVAFLGGKRKIQDEHQVYGALEEASREVYRRRYAGRYRNITSTGEFTRLVITAAKRRYLKSMKRTGQVYSLLDHDSYVANPLDADMSDNNTKLMTCIRYLPKDSQTILRLRYEEDLSFREIGTRMEITEVDARVKTMRARRKLAECFGQSN